MGEFDVSQQVKGVPICRLVGEIAQAGEPGQLGRTHRQQLAVPSHHLVVRVDHHRAQVTVDDDQVAAGHFVQQGAGAHHGRQFQALGQNRGVTALAAGFGHKAHDPLAVQAGRFAGGQVVGQHDGRLAQLDPRFRTPVEQVVE